MPPAIVSRRVEKSSSAKPGVAIRCAKRVFTPVITVNSSLPSSLTNAGRSRGFRIRRLRAPQRSITRQFTVSANTW
jgi:hypothetical protein